MSLQTLKREFQKPLQRYVSFSRYYVLCAGPYEAAPPCAWYCVVDTFRTLAVDDEWRLAVDLIIVVVDH